MGSLDENELVRMVQDFIESESPSPVSSASSKCHALNHRTQYFILQDILRSETAVESEFLKLILKHLRDRRDSENTTSLRKWLVTKLKMDGLVASLCQTSWITSLGCPAGEYEYVDIIAEDENGNPTKLIVDIDFRSQFELARPTQTYKELTDTLPAIFVGTEIKLCNIISLVCSAAKQSLRERGLHVPPWRTTSYMESKWLSGRHEVPASAGFGRNNSMEAKGGVHGFSKWVPPNPMVKPKKRDLGSGGSCPVNSLT
ncbi:DUF506 family protein [Quillaja saponaria]|uniref:DUF506 family protein n=1 Tax=Quillaja saponaria TaxID=32244 RepID=A0AAD7PJ17_QUISA|nr:DUF506 family protein [Quillaja saponaria]